MDTQKWREATHALAAALGVESLKQAVDLNPEKLLARAEEILRPQLREVLVEIVNDPDSSITGELSDRFYEDLDENRVIEGITPSLVSSMSAYLKEEGSEAFLSALTESIINDYLDFDWLAERVAELVANRLQIKEGP